MRPLQSVTLEAMIERTIVHLWCTFQTPGNLDRVNYGLHDTLMSGFAMMFFQHAESAGVSTQDAATSWSLQPGDDLRGP